MGEGDATGDAAGDARGVDVGRTKAAPSSRLDVCNDGPCMLYHPLEFLYSDGRQREFEISDHASFFEGQALPMMGYGRDHECSGGRVTMASRRQGSCSCQSGHCLVTVLQC